MPLRIYRGRLPGGLLRVNTPLDCFYFILFSRFCTVENCNLAGFCNSAKSSFSRLCNIASLFSTALWIDDKNNGQPRYCISNSSQYTAAKVPSSRGRSGAALCPSAASPSACTARCAGIRVYDPHRRVVVLRQLFAGKVQHFRTVPLAAGSLGHKQMADLAGFVADATIPSAASSCSADRTPSRSFSHLSGPAARSPASFFEIFLVADRRTDRAAASGHGGQHRA